MGNRSSPLIDLALAGAAGLAATQVMGYATTAMASAQSAADRAREKAVSPGVAYEVAAERTAQLAGIDASESQVGLAGSALHYALGVGWAPVYLLLRRVLGWNPVVAGLGAGMSLELIVDQGANAVLGLSAPPQDYPPSTHVRGFAGHAVYGLSLAAFLELAWLLLRRH